MSTIIKCTKCGEEIEISAALQGQIEEQVLRAAHEQHAAELEKVKTEYAQQSQKAATAAEELARKKLENEKELLKQSAEAELEIAKRKLEQETQTALKKATADQEMMVKSLRDDADSSKEESRKLREQLTQLAQDLREERKAKQNMEVEMQQRLMLEQTKIQEEASKNADEKYRLIIAEQEKKIADTKRALEEAQRKAAQGSQQLQGEILELDFETSLSNAFRDDEIAPVAKGTKGGDIKQVVKSPRGTVCGVMLWEIKRTKSWTDAWIPKLKEDLRSERADIAIIVSSVMPKEIKEDMGWLNGVWICKPALAVIMGTLLRKGLLDVARQKALADNRGTKAEALYSYVTSHEFVHQIELMVETYQEMMSQVAKERVAFEKMWSQRESQTQRLLLGTATLIGTIQGSIGQAAMPRIKGLELLEEGGSDGSQESLGI